MNRTIVQPAVLNGAPLADLKLWLGISRSTEDALLAALLHTSLDVCEAFTGQTPLEVTAQEIMPASDCWQRLLSTPIRAILGVEALAPDGTPNALSISQYEIDLDAEGTGLFRLTGAAEQDRYTVRFVAGIAQEWSDLPAALRHGIIRLAAHHYRDRDTADAQTPPASVAALWRGWRKMRLT